MKVKPNKQIQEAMLVPVSIFDQARDNIEKFMRTSIGQTHVCKTLCFTGRSSVAYMPKAKCIEKLNTNQILEGKSHLDILT